MNSTPHSDLDRLGGLIKDIHVAMLTSVDQDGSLHTRPLGTLEYRADGYLWFFTRIDSSKVDEVTIDERVSVSYADTDANTYVVASGSAEVIQDQEMAKELWTPMARAWFPQGVDDPELAILRVRIEQAEYWTSPGKAAYLFSAAKAAITGKGTTMGENRKMTLS